MMQYASPGVRNAARKGSNVIVHHGGHSGPGRTINQARSLHISSYIQTALHVPHLPPVPTLPPRNPPYKLFSASKNFLQRFFTHLTSPGLRAPTYLSQAQNYGARSLHSTAIHGATIQNGLSLPVRNALKNHALQRQANLFLPRGPRPVPPRCGGVAQVGLGLARNFSTARPIFQQLAQNVPVACRALYEIDWDLEMRKEQERMRLAVGSGIKKAEKSQAMMKPIQKSEKRKASVDNMEAKVQASSVLKEDIEHYFPTVEVAPVTTYLLIPLAPSPTARLPLPLNPVSSPTSAGWEPSLLPPLSFIGSLHASHSTHALRVSTLFARLDQANVWSRGGVHCSAYSQGHAHQRRSSKSGGSDVEDEGVCTVLQVEFKGWSKAEVRGVIGESGTGWCVLEEVFPEQQASEEDYSDNDSLASGLFDDESTLNGAFDMGLGFGGGASGTIDPAQSFVLPTLDFSSSFPSSASSLSGTALTDNAFVSIPSEMESDPWADEYPSSSSSYSDLSDLIIDPPSTNGWSRSNRAFGPGLGFSSQFDGRRNMEEAEPREGMFY